MNESNEDTLWQTMVYDQHYGKEIFEGLKQDLCPPSIRWRSKDHG